MSINIERHLADHPRVVDTVTVVALFVLFMVGARVTLPGVDQREELWPAALIAVSACAGVLLSRSHPRTAVMVTTVCAMTASALGYLLTVLILAPAMVAVYWLAILTDRRTTRLHCLGMIVMLVATATILDPLDHPLVLKTVAPVAYVLVPVAAGSARRMRRAYLDAVHTRAEHAERTREEEARHRVTEERMRIARELHDVVAHHLALANAQATTAAHLARSNPEQSRRMLGDLTGTTSSALRELKATVGLLRHADDLHTPLEPAPGLFRLPELIDTVRSAGLGVTLTTTGRERPLSPGVDLTAYRIVQEALTNITKHAVGATACVLLAYSADRLTITVTNNAGATVPAGAAGSAATTPACGFGIIGMRERAHSVGGDLEAGHRPEGGFEVSTALPLYPQPSEEEERTS
ncbi:sensor histidine kinase [Streptomyces turgidiscabies]|uniref:histidine kinase n=1 Tax=Streptomyces turgidiscabies (strain Car8) TaxID=698760 RepID=L7F3F9_STRT8|nr:MULTISPECIES: sensor histidine kinase [Streptomyces]ELP65546.1 histidine kinase [Streptomyces turgidiscabies Car8]MDX3491707.1 sensor histidine kinase [Streptomyces turgidiscabies]GAQ73314.1 sensor histidine kinase LiaS [Streptomyces turgidiscabies]